MFDVFLTKISEYGPGWLPLLVSMSGLISVAFIVIGGHIHVDLMRPYYFGFGNPTKKERITFFFWVTIVPLYFVTCALVFAISMFLPTGGWGNSKPEREL